MIALESQVRAFKKWAAIHRGNERNLKALIREKAWLKEDDGVAAIRSQIRKKPAFEAQDFSLPEGNPLLVLRFAEILDQENQTIRTSLQAMDKNNAALFAELKGELDGDAGLTGMDDGEIDAGGTAAGELAPAVDPAADMNPGQIEDRIRAWCEAAGGAGLFDADLNSDNDVAVLATTSAAVFDYLTANSEGMTNGLDIDSIKVHEHVCGHRAGWLKTISDALDALASGNRMPWPETETRDGCNCPAGEIRVCAFPGKDLNKIFNIPGRQVIVCLVKLNS